MQDDKRKNPLHQNKLRTYRKFKNIFKLEPYLINCNKQQRQIMTKFRVSAHNLNIERGRYIGLKVEERLCKLCYAGIEDEEHFLINCPTLHNTRKHYFDLIKRNCHNFVSLNSEQKLSWLMIYIGMFAVMSQA